MLIVIFDVKSYNLNDVGNKFIYILPLFIELNSILLFIPYVMILILDLLLNVSSMIKFELSNENNISDELYDIIFL